MTESVYESLQVIKSIHHKLFHTLHRVIEFRLRGRLPDVCFSHLLGDELQTRRMSLTAMFQTGDVPR
jgi:hypothetical protein